MRPCLRRASAKPADTEQVGDVAGLDGVVGAQMPDHVALGVLGDVVG
jgi:hypothetical protein